MCWRPARAHSVREFVEKAFARGRPADRMARQGRRRERRRCRDRSTCWSRSIRAISGRPRSISCSAIPTKARQKLGWRHRVSFDDLVDEMVRTRRSVDSDLERASSARLSDRAMNPPLLFDLPGKRVCVAGHRGMVGSAIVRRLASEALRDPDGDRATSSICARQEPTSKPGSHATKPDAVFRRRGAGRRHPRQQHAIRPISSPTISPIELNVIARRAWRRRRRSCCSSARPASIRSLRRSR